MVDNLLPEHVELPHVLDLAVLLVQLTTWMGRGGYTETFFPFSTISLEHSFMVKSYGWGGVGHGVVAHVIVVSPQSQSELDLDFGLVLVLVLV